MNRIIECVPNISEGRDKAKIDAIAAAAGSVAGVRLLDVDAGADTNRTVITLAGEPEAVLEAAFQLQKKAAELIDMQVHKGEHPRMGAVDVCPFVPVAGVSMEECVELARRLGKRVAEELGVPVYLYEHAATRPERRSLADVRRGEYEGLAKKISEKEWTPDFGKPVFNAKSGASIIGARPFLIAYNVNLNTRNKKVATELAQAIRETGKAKRDAEGNILKDSAGNNQIIPGMFQHCRAVGWYIESYGCAQVSINLTDYNVTNMHHVFDACADLAAKMGVRVTGSELVGLVPKAALLAAGRYYLQKQGSFTAVSESELIRTACRSLGLSELSEFNPEERIIEEKLKMPSPLADLTVSGFVDELSSDSVAPGGGSVSALAGALSAALSGMVCAITHSKPKLKEFHGRVTELGVRAQRIKDESVRRLDEDTQAFLQVITAMRALPKGVDKESAEYVQAYKAVDEAYKVATEIPLAVCESALEALKIAGEVAEIGLVSAMSDVAVAGIMAKGAFVGGAYNVRINLAEIKDAGFVEQTKKRLQGLESQVESALGRVLAQVDSRIST